MDLSRAQGVIIGDHAVQHNTFHLAPPLPVSWPVRVGVVPPAADCLQSRQHDAVTTGARVLTGLGGVGKTQLAAGLAERAWRDRSVDLLVWVNAGSRAAITSGYAQAAAALQVDGGQFGEEAADRFLAWLAGTERRWLIVLDDLADPADLRELWPPPAPGGSTVVTTRRRDAALARAGLRLVEVGLFTPAEAVAFLTAKLAGTPHLADDLTGLAADLGRLPLALAQAATYLRDRDLSCARYRVRFADRRRRLGDVLPEAGALPDDHRSTVAATWSLSVDRADQLDPAGLARPLLELASVLDPNGIPVDVLTAPAALAWLNGSDPDDVRDAVGCLHRLTLATRDPHDPARGVRVHALVQRATREQLSDDRRAGAVRAAADALLDVWPAVETDTDLGASLRANAAALAAADALWEAAAHPVLTRAGTSLGETGQVAAATDHHRQLAETAARRLGTDHPDTLTARHHAAYWQGRTGDIPGATILTRQLLTDRLRVLGPDHPDTLATRSLLARWRGEAGDVVGAVADLDRLVADRQRALGPDHPGSLTARSLLAFFRGQAGDFAGAVTDFGRLLADRSRLLGPDHPDTLETREKLVFWRGESGDPAGAATATEQLLADRSRILGPDHPDTLLTRNNLAHWQGHAGRPEAAADAFAALLADRLRVLGPDHPDTLLTRDNLATWRGRAGDPVAAAAIAADLAVDHHRVLGPDDPRTLHARGNLAYWQDRAGDPAGARVAFERLLADRLRIMGPDHPETLKTRNNLARVLGEAGDPTAAAVAFERLWADRQRVLGADHPHTLSTGETAAQWWRHAGNHATAAALFGQLLADRLRLLGPDHPDTERTRDDLARAQAEAGT